MATAAQIEANRRNSQRSTGPKTNGGKARVRRNDLKHGLATFTIMPTLSQENPKRLDGRTQEWIDDVQPQNAIERDLTAQAARLTLDIERAERIGMSHLAHRVLLAVRLRTRKLTAWNGNRSKMRSRLPIPPNNPIPLN